jgi:hypothetical protein
MNTEFCAGCGMPLVLDDGFVAGGPIDEPALCESCHYEDREQAAVESKQAAVDAWRYDNLDVE